MKCSFPSPSEPEGPVPTPSIDSSDNPSGLRDNFDQVRNSAKARVDTVTTPPPKESKYVVVTAPFQSREDPSTGHPSKDKVPIPQEDPFSRFWSGHTEDKDKRRHRWLIRKPERRHSADLEELAIRILDNIDMC